MTPQKRKIRCAIYTRKSTEDGLEQDFNSLHAQREACAAFVASQVAEGWVLSDGHFDDAGLSGGTLERPALQRLPGLVEDRQVDQIIVYKTDRLTRSLSDFSKIVDRLGAFGASFVSVTQAFNTATSLGRLTLNMLLSFAQFEREVTAERTRDKIAASKKKGLWMGGSVPLGYLKDGRTLKIDSETSPIINRSQVLYLETRSLTGTAFAARSEGLRTRKGNPFSRGNIAHILSNPIYAGRIRHHKTVYDGQHLPIIPTKDWEALQQILIGQSGRARGTGCASPAALLMGKIQDENGATLTPAHTVKNGKRIRYYVSRELVNGRAKDHLHGWTLPARTFEGAVAVALRKQLSQPQFAQRLIPDATARDIDFRARRIARVGSGISDQTKAQVMDLVENIDLPQSDITIRLSLKMTLKLLGTQDLAVDVTALQWREPFNIKRRGVETKLIIGEKIASLDLTRIRNVSKARRWYREIIGGRSLSGIASRDRTSSTRIARLLPLAFLTPDILTRITSGTQSVGFTTMWVLRTGFRRVGTNNGTPCRCFEPEHERCFKTALHIDIAI